MNAIDVSKLLYLEEEIKALWDEIDKLKSKNNEKEAEKIEARLPYTQESFGKLMIDVIKNAICDEVQKIRPEMSEKEILKGLEDGRIKITCARNSNWPFGKPFIPPKIEIE